MYKIAVIGDKDSILGFKALGIDVFYQLGEDLSELVEDIIKKDYAIIFITEELINRISNVIEKYEDSPVPVIIPIPSSSGSQGIGIMNMRKAAEKAIGADILFKDK